MQSDNETAETSADHHHHHQPQQHNFMTEHSHSSSPVLPFSSHLPAVPPNYIINNISSLQINNITPQEHQYYSQSSTTPNFFTPQFFQQWPHRQFQPRLEHQETYDNTSLDHILPAAVNFKVDANHDSLPENDRPCSLDFTTPKFCRQSITQDYSTSKQPFCKDIYVPNADRKNSELCNELEEVHGLTNYNQLTGSGSHSALTSENSLNLDPVLPFCHEEETSHHKKKKKKKKKRKRKSSDKELLSSMAGFFESLVEKVMSHQDRAQRGFLESMERIDRVRREREEEWRHQEAQTQNREAIARVHEQALASSREALIVSYLEKITGQTVDLPSRNSNNNVFSLDNMTDISTKSEMINNRWLRSEVEALISVRSGLESKFREPAGSIKGPIWEEVSALMGSMGYQRSAKRCKEKWENINKYFRKTKNDNVSVTKGTSSASSSSYCSQPLVDGFGAQRQSYMELLEAFTTRKSPCGLVAKPASSSGKLPDFDGADFHDKAEFERVDGHDLEKLKNVYDKVFEDEIQEDEEEEEEDDDLEDDE